MWWFVKWVISDLFYNFVFHLNLKFYAKLSSRVSWTLKVGHEFLVFFSVSSQSEQMFDGGNAGPFPDVSQPWFFLFPSTLPIINCSSVCLLFLITWPIYSILSLLQYLHYASILRIIRHYFYDTTGGTEVVILPLTCILLVHCRT